mgnify:CR=1 FL=1
MEKTSTLAQQRPSNPFGLGNITQVCADAIAIRTTNVIKIQQQTASASLTGDLFEHAALVRSSSRSVAST